MWKWTISGQNLRNLKMARVGEHCRWKGSLYVAYGYEISSATFFFLPRQLIFFIYVYFLIFYCIFPLPFKPLVLPSPCIHHTVVHVHESFFLFAGSLHPQPPHTPQKLSLSLSLVQPLWKTTFHCLVKLSIQVPNDLGFSFPTFGRVSMCEPGGLCKKYECS